MQEIIEDYENGGREDSGYVVMDVRGKQVKLTIKYRNGNALVLRMDVPLNH
jgi:hypothetical protein